MTYPFYLTDLPAHEYHARPEWSQSQLKLVLENPEKFRWLNENKPTQYEAQTLGVMVHTAVLEPTQYEAQFLVKPEGLNRRGEANKRDYEEFFYQAKKRGQTVVSAEDFEKALIMANRIRNHSEAAELLLGDGPAEVSLFAELEGLPMRGRVDKFHAQSKFLVDLKTTREGKASPSDWPRQIIEYRYDIQAVAYMSLWKHCFDVIPSGFKHVVIESEAPYTVAIYELGRTWIEVGKILLTTAIDVAKRCAATGVWPGYPVLDEPLECPSWELKRVMEPVE